MHLRYLLTLFLMLSFVLTFQLVFSQGPVVNPSSNFNVCTGVVSQGSCYEDSPTPILNWTYSGSGTQSAYWIQVDNNADYSSPLINTGWVSSSGARSYTIPSGILNFNTTYYWRIAVKDSFGSESGWTCADAPFVTVGACNYPPTATNLLVAKGDYCTTPSHYFSWIYSDPDGNTESRYQFQVDNNSDFSSPEVNRDYTGLSNPSPTTNNQVIVVAVSPSSDRIGYNTTYYWRVKVYDSYSIIANSGWVNGSSFTTDKHMYPTIDFSWSPFQPSINQETIFTDLATVYSSTKSAWAWTFEGGNPASSSIQAPVVQFGSAGGKQITLQVTDSDGYTCSDVKTLRVDPESPDWQEK